MGGSSLDVKHLDSARSRRHSGESGRGRSLSVSGDVFSSVEHSQNMRDKFVRQQLLLTLGGAGVIVLSFTIFAATSVWTFMTTGEALTRSGLLIRTHLAESVSGKVAASFEPVYETSRSLALQANLGHARSDGVWPPSAETFERRMAQLISRINVPLEADLSMRVTEAKRKSSSLIPHVSFVRASFALQADLATPATSLEECTHVFQAGATALQFLPSGGFEYTDAPVRAALATEVRADENGTKFTRAQWRLFDTRAKALDPSHLSEYDPSCESMQSLWDRPLAQADPFAGFWWHVRGGEDQYNAVYGNAPIATADGRGHFGYVSTAISMTDSIGPALKAMLEDGGDFTRGAHLAIVSASGRLRGASEFEDITGMYDVKDVPEKSSLSQAIVALEENAGSLCPDHQVVTSYEGRLIDSIPFRAEDYGMPPFAERWCVILSFPRENIYGAFDNATRQRVVTGSINIGLFVVAILLLVASLFLALKSGRSLRQEKMRADLRQVISAISKVQSLNCPMVLVPSRCFLGFNQLEAYESLRDRGAVVALDSIEDIMSFKHRNMILFFSHQWLGVRHPDEEGIQLAAMKGAIKRVLADQVTEQDVYIWCDYTSIPQQHKAMQQAAILSLPVYARVADKFIIVAPPAIHRAHHGVCDLGTYNERGWCRAEMLAKACGSGIDGMYTCSEEAGTLKPITSEDLSRMSFKIFEGRFSVEEDVETLVKPVLGLYSLVLRDGHLPHMRVIHAHIARDKERFFPRSYVNSRTRERVELFGRCISLMEALVSGNAKLWAAPSTAGPLRRSVSTSSTATGVTGAASHGSPCRRLALTPSTASNAWTPTPSGP